jgi:hypothetical protein
MLIHLGSIANYCVESVKGYLIVRCLYEVSTCGRLHKSSSSSKSYPISFADLDELAYLLSVMVVDMVMIALYYYAVMNLEASLLVPHPNLLYFRF